MQKYVLKCVIFYLNRQFSVIYRALSKNVEKSRCFLKYLKIGTYFAMCAIFILVIGWHIAFCILVKSQRLMPFPPRYYIMWRVN